MAKRSCEFLVAFGLVALSCKYDPRPQSGTQACASGSKPCPNGYTCFQDTCWIPAEIPPANQDASGSAPDAPLVVDGPVGSGTITTTGTGTSTGPACGGLNRTCCANKQCNAVDTVCNDSGVCVACGITGRPCCANDVCPGAGSICNAGNCVVCGSSGYVCCAGNTCLGIGTTCSAGNCVPCGASGQPCCAGNLCGATLACIGVTCQPPIPDGGISTSTGTTTARDAGIDASTTGTLTLTATGTPIVRDAGNDAATATSTVTATATKTKGDAGNDASTSTSTATIRTLPGTGIITSTSISTGTGTSKITGIETGVLPPVTGLTTGTLSAH
ncbi:MAG TPA: hypothetical protein VJ801_05705 [Polyangia bacterium]|jgi:hypothetical protein|nr:hypothetical protein [Polyangia bacterium]